LGAALSTVLGAWQFLRARRRVKVLCREDLVGDYRSLWEALIVEAVNRGYRPVTIVTLGLRSGDRKWIVARDKDFGSSKSLPKTIRDSQSVMGYFDRDEVELGIRPLRSEDLPGIRALARDAEGNEYTAKPPEDWLERIRTNKTRLQS
jgi:hypothetical protein